MCAAGPERSCVICREAGSPDRLIRVCAGDRGGLTADRERNRGGRGAYVHRGCLGETAARRPSVWERALRLPPGTVTAEGVNELVLAAGREADCADGVNE